MNWRVLTQSYTAIPMMLLAILAMMILPLPGWLLDALFTFNIVLAVLVLLVALRMALGLTYRPDQIYTVSPL